MVDFETVYNKHGEEIILTILHVWEQDNKTHKPSSMLLEDRWAHFISATEILAA